MKEIEKKSPGKTSEQREFGFQEASITVCFKKLQ